MERKNSYLMLALALVLFLFSIWMWVSRPLKTDVLKVEFAVGETLGVNLDSSSLNFGRVTLGGSAVRNVNIENNYGFPIKIKIFADKNIAEFITTEPSLVLQTGESLKLPVTLQIPEDMDFGNYSGKIKFEYRKA